MPTFGWTSRRYLTVDTKTWCPPRPPRGGHHTVTTRTTAGDRPPTGCGAERARAAADRGPELDPAPASTPPRRPASPAPPGPPTSPPAETPHHPSAVNDVSRLDPAIRGSLRRRPDLPMSG